MGKIWRFLLIISLSLLITVSFSPLIHAQKSAIISQQNQPERERLVKEVSTVGMTVSDMDQAIQFYTEVLNFTKISDRQVFGREYELLQGVFGARMRIVSMQLGEEIIELTEYLTPKGKPIPIDSRSNDLWFQHIAIVVSDMDQAYQHLQKFNIQHVSTAPQLLPDYIPAAAGIEAFYFQDPDRHNLEIIYFPEGKGDPRWQKPTDQLFLGIDHTAIAVSDTATSLKFYQDLLGLDLLGESQNYGTEQEHLNQVFGAYLRISGLKAPLGTGVEFLEYISPSNGKPRSITAQSNDLIHWETTMIVADADQAFKRLLAQGADFVSAGVISLPQSDKRFQKAFLVKDPDGHVLRIVEQ